ncbi:unnamed protein product [Paramecium sonneborni]|uniref:Uncharacterized protein n=1 Tax=Paramecium sonneborni TaxID=65129 RepID=A0A8S1K1U2_9CILI|nr:unnamed protein product [Paramecium sonneborni]
MLDSTTNLKSPQFQKSIKSKQELQSFYHYSKIMKLKELTQKPSQLSINYNLSQHNSIGLRQSDHISNFEFFIQQNSRHNYHRQIREQYQYHSQSALTKNQTEKINWQKHKENQKKIEQAINKYKFNHSLETNQQSITRRRIQRLSSETSTQSKFFIESRPTSKQRTQLQNQILLDSKQKKQSIKAASTQHQSQIDQYDYEISPKDQNLENLVNKILDSKQEQQSEMNEDYESNVEEEQEFEEQIIENQIINQIEGRQEQIEKQLDNNLRRQLQRNIVKQDNKKNEQVQLINKQTNQKLQQTKKKLKASIQQQLLYQSDQIQTVAPIQQKQQSEIQTILPPQKTNDDKQLKNNDEYIKQLREEQNLYKLNQQILQKEEEKNQQIKLLEIQKIQEEIERKKNKKEDFVYQFQEDNTEEQFIKKQQQLKLDNIEQQKKEEERLLREQQQKREKDEQLNKAKQLEEEKQKEIEENKKKELAQLIQKQKNEIEKQIQEEMAKQPPKLEKQKSVLIIPKQVFQERKKSQEEIETSNRQIKREIESKIQKQKEEEEKEELEQLDFVEYMLRSKNVYDVNYDKFKLYEDKLKKVKEPPNNLEEDELNIYNFLKNWKQINKKGQIKILSLQIKEIQESTKT